MAPRLALDARAGEADARTKDDRGPVRLQRVDKAEELLGRRREIAVGVADDLGALASVPSVSSVSSVPSVKSCEQATAHRLGLAAISIQRHVRDAIALLRHPGEDLQGLVRRAVVDEEERHSRLARERQESRRVDALLFVEAGNDQGHAPHTGSVTRSDRAAQHRRSAHLRRMIFVYGDSRLNGKTSMRRVTPSR